MTPGEFVGLQFQVWAYFMAALGVAGFAALIVYAVVKMFRRPRA